jgi:hypothetical protein
MTIWPFYDHLAYFVAIWYILWLFGIFFLVLVYCTKKNLATLAGAASAADPFCIFAKFRLQKKVQASVSTSY